MTAAEALVPGAGESVWQRVRSFAPPSRFVPVITTFALLVGMFGAGVQWTVRFMLFGQAVIFIAGAWAAWNFFQADDPVTQLRWGLPAAVLLLGSLAVKLAIGPPVFHNRVMRELKRIELQLARGAHRT